MNMDFVQRNLINERNNLQVELAKAKALIAELSEATNYNNSPCYCRTWRNEIVEVIVIKIYTFYPIYNGGSHR